MAFSFAQVGMGAPSWLYTLRWVAILGMSATIMVGRTAFGLEMSFPLVGGLIGFLVLWNLFSLWLENHFPGTEMQYAVLQVCVDLVILTAILWQSGGLVNPFVGFYVLHVLMAGLLLTPLLTACVALLTVGFILLLTFAGPLVLANGSYGLRALPYWAGIPTSLILLVLLSAGFILVYLQRLKFAQEESLHREKMAAVGRLVAGMAHEMGTPLNVILLLAKDLHESAPESYREDLQMIVDQAKRCGDLVSLLLGYSHPSKGNTSTIKSVGVELEPWLESAFVEAKNSVSGSKAALNLMIQANHTRYELPELVLRQVVVNLLKNSLQATCEKADALISINISEDVDLGQLRVLVRDNGPGFSKKQRDRAFEAFFTTKGPGEGEGLGLYISYYLMEQIGGYVSIPRDLQSSGGAVEIRVPFQRDIKELV